MQSTFTAFGSSIPLPSPRGRGFLARFTSVVYLWRRVGASAVGSLPNALARIYKIQEISRVTNILEIGYPLGCNRPRRGLISLPNCPQWRRGRRRVTKERMDESWLWPAVNQCRARGRFVRRRSASWGAGLVRIAVPEGIQAIVAGANPCYLTSPLPQDAEGVLSDLAESELLQLVKGQDVVAAGPGVGRSEGVTRLVYSLVSQVATPLVLDADGLNALANHPNILKNRSGPIVITPHPGEFARLLKVNIPTIQRRRQELAGRFAADTGAIVVLKGHGTIVTDGRRLYVNSTGNPGMATGGTGDVLAGLIAALIGQGLEPFAAAQLGVHLHGLAGDLARDDLSEVSLVASDLLTYLPRRVSRVFGIMIMNLLCPHCQKMLTVPDLHAGQMMQCPLCGNTFTAPALAPATETDAPRMPVYAPVAGPPPTSGACRGDLWLKGPATAAVRDSAARDTVSTRANATKAPQRTAATSPASARAPSGSPFGISEGRNHLGRTCTSFPGLRRSHSA